MRVRVEARRCKPGGRIGQARAHTRTHHTLQSNGHFVSYTDHEGPSSAFIGGHNAGQSVLDGIRALRADQKLPGDTKVLMAGYSGGAHATAWAVNVAGLGYAPDVNIVGAAYGGTPIDPRAMLEHLSGSFFAGFGVVGVSGLAIAYPPIDGYLQANLNQDGKAAIQKVRSPGFCATQAVLTFAGANIYSWFSHPNPLDDEPNKSILAKESLLQRISPDHISSPRFPRLLVHAKDDQIIPRWSVENYLNEQVSA